MVDGTVTEPLAEGPALEAHLSGLRADFARFLMTWSIVVDGVWWLTDPFLLRGVPGAVGAFAAMRVCVLACGFAALALLRGQRTLDGARLVACVALWSVEVGAIAGCLAKIGDLSTPWFHCLYPVVIATCIFPFSIRARTAFASVLGAALLAGFVAGRPDAVHPPFFGPTVGYMAFAVGIGVAFGHRFHLLTCDNFRQRRLVAAQREDLRRQVELRTEELRDLAQHLDRVSEDERHRIARDLHDDLGQSVTALRLSLATARKRFDREPSSIGANLDDLTDLVRRVSDGTRDAVAHLRPRVLDDRGFAAAAEWLVRTTERHCGVPCALRVEGDDPAVAVDDGAAPAPDAEPAARAADAVSLVAFRVLQEALSNVVRHAGATHVVVMVRFDDALSITVDDDGAGLPAASERGRGMGMLGMRERARAVGGTVAFEARPGGGTRVRCVLPLRAHEVAA